MKNSFLPGLDFSMSGSVDWPDSSESIEENSYLDLKYSQDQVEPSIKTSNRASDEKNTSQGINRSYENQGYNVGKTLLKARNSQEPPKSKKEFTVKEIKRKSEENKPTVVVFSVEKQRLEIDEDEDVQEIIDSYRKETEEIIKNYKVEEFKRIEETVKRKQMEYLEQHKNLADLYRIDEAHAEFSRFDEAYENISDFNKAFDEIELELGRKLLEMQSTRRDKSSNSYHKLRIREDSIKLLTRRVQLEKKINTFIRLSQEKQEKLLKQHFSAQLELTKRSRDYSSNIFTFTSRELQKSISDTKQSLSILKEQQSLLKAKLAFTTKSKDQRLKDIDLESRNLSLFFQELKALHAPFHQENLVLKQKIMELVGEIKNDKDSYEEFKKRVEDAERLCEGEEKIVEKLRKNVKNLKEQCLQLKNSKEEWEKAIPFRIRKVEESKEMLEGFFIRVKAEEEQVEQERCNALDEAAAIANDLRQCGSEFDCSYYNVEC